MRILVGAQVVPARAPFRMRSDVSFSAPLVLVWPEISLCATLILVGSEVSPSTFRIRVRPNIAFGAPRVWARSDFSLTAFLDPIGVLAWVCAGLVDWLEGVVLRRIKFVSYSSLVDRFVLLALSKMIELHGARGHVRITGSPGRHLPLFCIPFTRRRQTAPYVVCFLMMQIGPGIQGISLRSQVLGSPFVRWNCGHLLVETPDEDPVPPRSPKGVGLNLSFVNFLVTNAEGRSTFERRFFSPSLPPRQSLEMECNQTLAIDRVNSGEFPDSAGATRLGTDRVAQTRPGQGTVHSSELKTP